MANFFYKELNCEDIQDYSHALLNKVSADIIIIMHIQIFLEIDGYFNARMSSLYADFSGFYRTLAITFDSTLVVELLT